jgi:TolB-like protein
MKPWLRLAAAAALVGALFAAGASGWRSGVVSDFLGTVAEDKLAQAPRLSIVVLPFKNMSGDKEQDYFADGITDDLTADLSHLDGSFVIARSTAFTYQDKPVDAKEIGRELGVRYLLEGSARRVGETTTVNAELISTETGAHLWADHFEGERNKLGDLQVEIVARLANSLGLELVKAEALRAMRENLENPEAADLAMEGEAMLHSRRSEEALNGAIGLFERALALEPQNARAMRGMAISLTRRFHHLARRDDPSVDLARAEEMIDGALAIQGKESETHRIKGMVLAAKHEWRPAIAEAELAVALDRNNAKANADASLWKMYLGRSEEGFAGVETAFRLSPRDSAAPTWQFGLCLLRLHLAQWDEAVDQCNKAVAAGPQSWYPLVGLAAANAWAGHHNEARKAAEQLQKIYPGFTAETWAGIHWSDDPTFSAQNARIVEGLRKAGLEEQ